MMKSPAVRKRGACRAQRLPWVRSVSLLAGFALAGLWGCARLDQSPSGSVLFQDDFSRTASGWDQIEGSGYRVGYSQGGYHLRLDRPDGLVWGTPRFDLQQVRLEVDTLPVAGPSDNAFGLVCRYRDPDNFYFFLISSDGFAGIGAVLDGERQMLTAATLLPSEAILEGASPNHMRADCSGNRLTLTVNGIGVGEVLVPGSRSGDVGVIAGSYAEGGVEIRFDNFVVLTP